MFVKTGAFFREDRLSPATAGNRSIFTFAPPEIDVGSLLPWIKDVDVG